MTTRFPAVDSNWDQPSKSFVASLNQTIGNTATNTLQFSYSANKIEITRGGLNVGCTTRSRAALQPILGYSSKQYGNETGHPVFWGGGGYQALWNEAPFLNNQDLFIVKDDYTKVFGKHFVKAGVLASMNKKNEDTIGNGSSQHSRFWGADRHRGWGTDDRQRPGRFPAAGHAVGLLRALGRPLGAAALERPGDVRGGFVAGRTAVTLDYGVRYSLFYNPYAADDKITSFVPALFNPALGNDPCNGLLQPARNELVPGRRRARRHGRAEPLADGPGLDNFAPRARHRLGRARQRQDGAARRDRPVLPARAAHPGARASPTTRRS